jgi:hypothetical protein
MKRLAFFLAAVFAVSHPAFCQCTNNPLKQWLYPPCPNLMDTLSKAIDAAQQYAKIVVKFNAEVGSARQRYWKAFANGSGPELDAAELAFLKDLNEKDLIYLQTGLVQGMGGDVAKIVGGIAIFSGTADASTWGKFPSDIDGGNRPYAFPLFANWVDAIRRREGREHDNEFASWTAIAEAYVDKSNWKRAYEDARNWSEFLSSGLDISKYVTPKEYLVRQIEAEVALTAQRSKPVNPPDPLASALDFYSLFVKMFGEKEVLAAAVDTLRAPKNSIGGLRTRIDVEVGTYFGQSPNPYMLFITRLTHGSPRAYAISLALDQYGLMGNEAAYTLYSKDKWEHAFDIYNQLGAKYGAANVTAAAARLLPVPKDASSGIKGDRSGKNLVVWFDTLVKNPKAEIPDGQVARFRTGSYDPRWKGQMVEVRGTVSSVDIAKGKFPPWGTVHFKDSTGDKFTVFTPNSDILEERFGANGVQLVGRTVEVAGTVESWKAGAGIKFLTHDQLKVLDGAAASSAFTESKPGWLTAPTPEPAPAAGGTAGTAAPRSNGAAPVTNVPDSSQYLAWKKFPPGAKATYENRLYSEARPGTQQYTRQRISQTTFQLQSVDSEKVSVTTAQTTWNPRGGVTHSSNDLVYRAHEVVPPLQLPGNPPPEKIQTTQGEETLVISGKSIATRWERIALADDPSTYIKTWTSDDVPGGLVLRRNDVNKAMGRTTVRSIGEVIYAPVEGTEPEVTSGSAQADLGVVSRPTANTGMPATPRVSRDVPGVDLRRSPAAAPPASTAAPVAPAPPAGRGGMPDSASPPASQLGAWTQRYRSDMIRMGRVRSELMRRQNGLARPGSATNVPAEIREASDRLQGESQAVTLDFAQRNYSRMPQSLEAFEGDLNVIEEFLAK